MSVTVTATVLEVPRATLIGQSRTSIEESLEEGRCPETLQESSPEDDGMKMPDRASLCLMYYMSVLLVTNIVVVIPTANQYAEKLGGSESFSGLMIGLTPAFAGIGVLLTQLMLRVMTMKSLIFTFLFGSVLGNCLYALAGLTRWPYTLLFARAIIGLCAGTSVPPLFVAATVGIKKRTEVTFCLQSMACIGYVLGPLLAWALEVFVKELHIENLVLDSDTMPGWCLAFLYFLLIPKVFFLFRNPSSQLMQAEPQKQEKSATGSRLVQLAGVLFCLWAMFVLTISTSCAEVFAATHSSRDWAWSVDYTSLYLAGMMAGVGPMTLSAGRLVRAVEDRKGLFGVCGLAMPLCILVFNFNIQNAAINTVVFSIGLISIFASSAVARSFISAMMTKIVPPHWKGAIASMGIMALCAGRGAGSFLGPLLGQTSHASLQIGIFASTFILAYILADSLKAKDNAC